MNLVNAGSFFAEIYSFKAITLGNLRENVGEFITDHILQQYQLYSKKLPLQNPAKTIKKVDNNLGLIIALSTRVGEKLSILVIKFKNNILSFTTIISVL